MGAHIINDEDLGLLQRLENFILQALTVKGCLETLEQMPEVHEQTPYTVLKGETAGEGCHEEGFAYAVGSGQKESLFRQTLTPCPLLNSLDCSSKGGRRLVMELQGLKRCLDI